MIIQNAIRKVEKTLKIKMDQPNRGFYTINTENQELSFRANGGDIHLVAEDKEVTCIRVRRLNDKDEIETDYVAGSFFDNITQAIKFVKWQEEYMRTPPGAPSFDYAKIMQSGVIL